MPSPFLSEPKTEKLKCENVLSNGLEIGHASMQGLRVSMEDEHIIECTESLKDHVIVAIMDGTKLHEPSSMDCPLVRPCHVTL